MYRRCVVMRSRSKTTPFQLLCQRHTITLTASFFFYIDTDTHSFYVIEQWKFYINTDNFMHIHKMPIFEAITLLTYPKVVETVAMKVNGFWIYIFLPYLQHAQKTNISSSSLAISKTFNWIHCDHIFRTFYGTIQFQIKAHGNFSNSFWQWKQFQTNEVKWNQKQGKMICIWQFNGTEIIRNVPSLLIQTPEFMLNA